MLLRTITTLLVFCCFQSFALGQIGAPKPDVYAELEPLDITHSNNQRLDIKQRFLAMGYRLKGNQSDIKILQRMLSLGKIQRTDIATQQAMGIVLGDLFAQELNMHWVIVEDKYGRSRALRYKKSNIILFPVSMLSRRYKTGLNVDIQALYDKNKRQIKAKIKRLPGY